MACVCADGTTGKKEGKRCSGRQEAGPGAAVRIDQSPLFTLPQPPHYHRGQAGQGGSSSRAQEDLLGPLLGKGGTRRGGRAVGARRGRRSHRDHESHRQRPGRGSAGWLHPRRRAGSSPHEAVAEGSAHTSRIWTWGLRWKADPRPQPRQSKRAQKLSTNPWLVAGSGLRPAGKFGRIRAGLQGAQGHCAAHSPEPLELRVLEQWLQHDTQPAETAAHHLQGRTWCGAQWQPGQAAWAL